jgi:hypothetical protein
MTPHSAPLATPKSPGFGPWAPGLADAERAARWRSLAALAMVYGGGVHPLLRLCLEAECNAAAADLAWRALETLAPLPRRRLLSAFAGVTELARLIAAGAENVQETRPARGRR